MVTYAKVYEKLDPIIKANPKITWEELKKKHPDILISNWSFHARKKKVMGLKGYGHGLVRDNKKKRAYVRKQVAENPEAAGKISAAMITKAIRTIAPKTQKKKEYLKLGKILVENPNAIHSHLKKAKKVTMCDANFYQFRKKFCDLLNLPLTASLSRFSKLSPRANSSAKKKPGIYTVLYQRESNGFDENTRNLVMEIFEVLHRERIANLEMVELVHPEKLIEIRSR